jgi:hypothetical protein
MPKISISLSLASLDIAVKLYQQQEKTKEPNTVLQAIYMLDEKE